MIAGLLAGFFVFEAEAHQPCGQTGTVLHRIEKGYGESVFARWTNGHEHEVRLYLNAETKTSTVVVLVPDRDQVCILSTGDDFRPGTMLIDQGDPA